jgi:dinuclear metal center YbgI/SA1388 family protein
MTALVRDVTDFLDAFAPPALAESWDNVGLLLGDRDAEVRSVLTCLTLTPDVADEAIRASAGLVVTHHPILFRAVKRLTTDTAEGRMILALARAGVAVYSPHTAFDSAARGVNARLAGRLGLNDVAPLRLPASQPADGPTVGGGRFGVLPEPCDFTAFAVRAKAAFGLPGIDAVVTDRRIRTVAVACGSAAEFLPDAAAAGCDVLVTGEARFHAAIEARSLGISLILLGHYASERFAVEELATEIADRFPNLAVRASKSERDPLTRL